MNANELADAMQSVISVLNVHHEEDCLFIANKAQFMLRQKQAEIEALKGQYKFGVDWSKDGNAVTVLKICEDGVAEIVFADFNSHPVKELDEDFDAICLENKRLQAEIEALKDMLEEEGIGVSQKYLDERIAELGKVQEK